ncbi:hypothetical protein [Brucella suis]
MEDFSKRIAARHRIRALGHCGGGVRQPASLRVIASALLVIAAVAFVNL